MRGRAAILSLALAVACGGGAQAIEFAIKATYLYRFGAFVEWPAGTLDAAASAVLCVVGEDPFGVVLDRAMAGQRVHDRPIEVRRLPRLDAESGCHIAYVGASPVQLTSEALRAVQGQPVLTFTDSALHPDGEGIVHFVIDGNRVRFRIDDRAAAENRLTISSRVLNLALSVKSRS